MMNDWEKYQGKMSQWGERPLPFENQYPEGTIPEDMTIGEYAEIQALYIRAHGEKSDLNPVVVIDWWYQDTKQIERHPLGYVDKPWQVGDDDEQFPFDDENDWEY